MLLTPPPSNGATNEPRKAAANAVTKTGILVKSYPFPVVAIALKTNCYDIEYAYSKIGKTLKKTAKGMTLVISL